MLLRLSLAALITGTLALPVHALASPAASAGFAQVDVVEAAQYVAVGAVYDYEGNDLDNVLVTATPVGGSEIAASALSYGGMYELWLDDGSYALEYTLDGHEPVRATVVVDGQDAMLADVTMLLVAPQNTVAPSLDGRARVGEVLTAEPGAWDLDVTGFAYQWRVNGRAVRDADGRRFRVLPQHYGKTVSVDVTADLEGHAPGEASSAGAVVRAGRFSLTSAAVRRGDRWRVGLEVDAPAWAAPDGTAKVCMEGVGCATTRMEDGAGRTDLPVRRRSARVTVTFDGSRAYDVAPLTFTLRGR